MRLFSITCFILSFQPFLFERCKDTVFFQTSKYNLKFLSLFSYKIKDKYI